MEWYSEARWKLGPMFYCRLCDRREKDLERGCPKCELTQLFEDYQHGAGREIKRFTDGLPEGVTIQDLQGIYLTVELMLKQSKDEIMPEWSATLAGFAEIIHQERRQKEYDDKWSHYQDLKRLSKK